MFQDALSGDRVRQLLQIVPPSGRRPGFAIRQLGRVLAFDAEAREPARVVLDLDGRIDLSAGENGLVSMALDPSFADNGRAYFVYTAPSRGVGRHVARVSRFLWSGTAFIPGSELVILEIPQHDVTHSVNHVAFGADGMLYVSVGDQRRTDVHAQNPSTLPGSILRIDVRGARAGAPYQVPPDNPFVGVGAEEVYAIGLRNPFRMTVDPVDGTILVGDVGQDRREEINRVVAGGNYGWPDKEGTLCFRRDPCDDLAYIDPLVEAPNAEALAIVAGHRYRRNDVPGLEGRLLYADFVTGRIYSADAEDEATVSRLELEAQFMIGSFALDEQGRHYVVRYDPTGDAGGVYRLVPNRAEPSTFPRWLSQTGCVDPEDPRQPAAGMVSYAPLAELWSDGSDKSRSFAIPDGTAIAVGADGSFDLPVGSVTVKHFGFDGRYHETRLMMRTEEGWSGYSYRWNEVGTDAELLPAGTTVTLPNGVRWQYPARSACVGCHSPAASNTLSLEAAQLDDEQLSRLLHDGYFDRRLTTLEALRGDEPRTLVDPFGDAAVDARARSYLHANCSMCHRPGGPGRGEIDLRFDTAFRATGLCDAEPREGRLWGYSVWDEQRLIAPGRPDHSILHMRISTLGRFRMPPIASERVHDDAVDLMGRWITELRSCDEPRR